MAITVDQLSIGTGTGHNVNATLTTTATVAAGGMIVLGAGRFQLTSANTLTASGGGLTWSVGHQLSSGSIRTVIFLAPAPAGLASGTVITVTPSANVATTDILLIAESLLGVDTVSPVSATNGAAASTAAWATGSLTAASGDAVVGVAFADGLVGTSTATGPAAEWGDFNNATQSESITGAHKLSVAGTDSVAGTWSGAVSHVAVGIGLKAAAATASIPILVTAPPIST